MLALFRQSMFAQRLPSTTFTERQREEEDRDGKGDRERATERNRVCVYRGERERERARQTGERNRITTYLLNGCLLTFTNTQTERERKGERK